MIPEYGHLALIFAFIISIALSIIPLIGTFNGRTVWMASSRSLATGLFVFVGISYACLTWSFYVDDFSVQYVSKGSHTALPVMYKLTAVWGGHEGSLLLWALMDASTKISSGTTSGSGKLASGSPPNS